MMTWERSGDVRLRYAALLALVFVSLSYIWQVDKGFDLADEGFLWYGSQRVSLGEVPIRDFMAYDPGRYYWSAFFMSWWDDDGILAQRGAIALFQAAGLFVAILLVAKSSGRVSLSYLVLAATLLLAWMLPRHKLFDISVSIFLVAALAYLAAAPSRQRYVLVGVCVGLAATFGRNHGVYGVIGSLTLFVSLALASRDFRGQATGLWYWGLGVLAGFSPVLVLAAVEPGFASEFLRSVRFLFEIETTNLFVPIPWPWTADFDGPAALVAHRIATGVFFLALGGYVLFILAWLMWRSMRGLPVPAVMAAGAALALPYAHHAYSRADVPHLAQGIFPLLIGVLAYLATMPGRPRSILALALLGGSLLVTLPHQPGWRCAVLPQCSAVAVSGDILQVEPPVADDIALIDELVRRYAADGERFLFTPFWPGAHAMHRQPSPMWSIYSIFSRRKEFQLREIERIRAADPIFIMVFDFALDGRDDLRFTNSHAEVARFITSNYAKVDNVTSNPAHLVFMRKGKQEPGAGHAEGAASHPPVSDG